MDFFDYLSDLSHIYFENFHGIFKNVKDTHLKEIC